MRGIGVVVLVLASVCGVVAQTAEGRNEIGLTLGGEIIPSRTSAAGAEVNFGRGLAFAANYARRLAGTDVVAYLEVPFTAVPNHEIRTLQGDILRSLATLYITPSLRVQFAARDAVSPWISGGFGYGLFEGAQVFPNGSRNPRRHVHTATAQFGGGVDVRTPVKIVFPISIRGEARDFYTIDSPGFGAAVRGRGQHNIVVSGGFVIHF